MKIAIWIFQAAFCFITPAVVLRLAKRSKIVRSLSPVVVCYLAGMALINQPFVEFDRNFSMTLCGVAVALAIPMLLYSVDFVGWFRLAGSTMLAFSLASITVVIAAIGAHYAFRPYLADTAPMAGMLTGVYIGGTGNMNAVGIMVNAKPDIFVMLNTADMIWSFAYLAFLMTVAGRIFGLFLRPFPYEPGTGPVGDGESWDGAFDNRLPPWRPLLLSTGLTLLIVAAGLLVKGYLPANSQDAVFVLIITTLGILASFNRRIRAWPGTQGLGQYLMVSFFCSLGFTADLGKLFGSSLMIFIFDAVVIIGSVALHMLTCWLFRIDRDTAIITSVAAIFSPPFVPSVAMALRNKEVLVSGIASGLIGYAIANYIGAAVTWLLL